MVLIVYRGLYCDASLGLLATLEPILTSWKVLLLLHITFFHCSDVHSLYFSANAILFFTIPSVSTGILAARQQGCLRSFWR